MKVRLMLMPPPSFSESTVTADAHHHRCCYRRHHRHHRCVRREDPEIDNLCTSTFFLLFSCPLAPCLLYLRVV